jgi:hypothetical protein
MVLVVASFAGIFLASGGGLNEIEEIDKGNWINYVILFGFYLVNYFIITFFNVALIHCTRLYFNGQEATVQDGINYSMTRLKVILSWSIFAATIGFILKAIQENAGWLGKIITGLIGIVWSIASFFAMPVIAYEDLGPLDAFKRSAQLMREKWGESLGSRFSFVLINLIALLIIVLPLFLIGSTIHIGIAFVLGFLGLFFVMAIMSSAQTIFVSAVYHNISGDPVEHFNQQMIDGLFQTKK